MLFAYEKRFDEALKRGQVYWPGESLKKFGLQIANIEPVHVAMDELLEWGEIVVIDADGKARSVQAGDAATDFYGVVHRNATATYSVLSEQVFQYAPRLTISVFRGGREGVIAVPVQQVGSTPVAKGGSVYVRIAASGTTPELPIGGIETEEIAGETVLWEDAVFAEPVSYPFKDEKFTDATGPTTAVAGIEIK